MNNIKKLRVAVFMGGKSMEREVSFNSGRTICDHLDTDKYEIIPIFQNHTGELYILPWRFLHRGKTTDFVNRLEKEAEKIIWDQLKDLVDFVYIAVHGRYAEDGTLQGFMELLGIPYLGSKIFGSAVGMNKSMQKHFLNYNNIETPKGITVSSNEIINFEQSQDKILDSLKSLDIKNLIIKPAGEGSSLGISVINNFSEKNIQEFKLALKKASFMHNGLAQDVLVEEKISGLEFTCIVLTDYISGEPIVLPITEIVYESGSEFFDYDQKYMPGRATKYTPARCSQEITESIQKTCLQVMKALNLTNLCRIDGIVTEDNRVVIIDPNTLSGMGPTSFLFRQAAKKFSHARLINHLIETELASYKLLNINTESVNKIIETNKLRVSVIMGGRSNEREISLESGRNVTYKLSKNKYEITPLFLTSKLELYYLNTELLILNSTSEIERELSNHNAKKVNWADLTIISDFVFLALHGGEGENGSIQGTLEMLGLPYNGSSVLASSIGIDKHITHNLLEANGFDVPKEILLSKTDWLINRIQILSSIKNSYNFPLILKPHNDGCSVHVSKIDNTDNLEIELESAFGLLNSVLVQEYITGVELTVGVIGNGSEITVLPASQVVAQSGILSIEEKFLPGAGENQTPALLQESAHDIISKTVGEVYKLIGCSGYARIDCFYQEKTNKVIILEINTLPALTPATCLFHQAAEIGLKPADVLDKIISLGLELHNHISISNKAEISSHTERA